jgi:hypothetical protein
VEREVGTAGATVKRTHLEIVSAKAQERYMMTLRKTIRESVATFFKKESCLLPN